MKNLIILLIFLFPAILLSQNFNYKGKGALINAVNGNIVEDVNRTYWTIKNDTIKQYLNKKRTKLFETNILGISENDDWKIKWTLKTVNEKKGEFHLIKQGIDKFTEKSYKTVYYLFREE
ncbi:MAG: hypothetical protein HKP48_09775 [Winogradskyella sp.]|uniref:hypothetical protein n=1 Tax=Winogradskyella sp. TaxID=1883156 RepID=UPI00181F91F7|nr:hypothetical protein [Winogradskyella sp.]MBT8245637.1 hypothetical protein [Winogradskyella sp.]NNK23555.1 hypothetical protein [Winogradskyella sp.]